MFWYLSESPHGGDSNKYPKHMFYEEIGIKQDLSYISVCSLSILYNSKFILMAASLGTNAVVVTKVHCIFTYVFTKVNTQLLIAFYGRAHLGSTWFYFALASDCHWAFYPAGILYKSIVGRYRPVRVPDGPITARHRFIKNASWVLCSTAVM